MPLMISRREFETQLTPWLPLLDDGQIRWLQDEARDIERRWPGSDYEPEREAALDAAVRWITGDITTAAAGRALLEAHERAALALTAARQIARMAVLHGMPEAQAALESGVEPMTLRRDLADRVDPSTRFVPLGSSDRDETRAAASTAASGDARGYGDQNECHGAADEKPGKSASRPLVASRLLDQVEPAV